MVHSDLNLVIFGFFHLRTRLSRFAQAALICETPHGPWPQRNIKIATQDQPPEAYTVDQRNKELRRKHTVLVGKQRHEREVFIRQTWANSAALRPLRFFPVTRPDRRSTPTLPLTTSPSRLLPIFAAIATVKKKLKILQSSNSVTSCDP